MVLLVTYVASLVFTLKTHRNLYASDKVEHATERIWPAVGMLFGATIGVAWMSELSSAQWLKPRVPWECPNSSSALSSSPSSATPPSTTPRS